MKTEIRNAIDALRALQLTLSGEQTTLYADIDEMMYTLADLEDGEFNED